MAIALIVGGADNVWEDAVAAMSLFTPDATFLVKSMIAHWPLSADYGITLHPEWISKWLRERPRLSGRVSDKLEIWAHKRANNLVDKVTDDWQGSSGLLAVKVALEEGFDGIVLAGVPMDAQRNHFVRKVTWSSCQMFRKGWEVHLPTIRDKTRSMSGWTQERLGAPTTEWLLALNASPPNPDRVENLRSRRCLA